jgi:hypothetical protein
MLWPQDVKRDLTTRSIINPEILDIDWQRTHLAHLRLIKGDSPLFGTKGEQKGGLCRSLRERLRLRF